MNLLTMPALLLALTASTGAVAESAQLLPADFRHARIFVLPETVDGDTIEFYTDTGGGFNAITHGAAELAGLETETTQADGREITIAEFPQFLDGQGIPPGKAFMDGRLVVVDDKALDEDGFLGGRWFAGKTWRFDYLSGTLSLLENWQAPANDAHAVKLGFQVNASGERTMHFARMAIEVDGEAIDVLLDTGANAMLTESSAPHFDVEPGTRVGTSFIIQSIFEQWANKHPDWTVVQAGDSVRGKAFPMIRVPEVTIAGQTVGPVWFTQRPDRNFNEYMSRFMDAPVKGAVGGSAFRYFRMIVDYPGSTAYFYRE